MARLNGKSIEQLTREELAKNEQSLAAARKSNDADSVAKLEKLIKQAHNFLGDDKKVVPAPATPVSQTPSNRDLMPKIEKPAKAAQPNLLVPDMKIEEDITRIKNCAERSQFFVKEAVKNLNLGDLEQATKMDNMAKSFEKAMYESQRNEERRTSTLTKTQQARVFEGTKIANIRINMAEEYKEQGNTIAYNYLLDTSKRITKKNMDEQYLALNKRNNSKGR